MAVAIQGPQADLDYSHDYANELDATGSPNDNISSATWSLEQSPDDGSSPSPVVHSDSISGSVVTAWVRNLQVGNVYVLKNVTTTTQGRVFEHSWTIRCAYV